MSTFARKLRRLVPALATGLLVAAGCGDDGKEGPGTLAATVESATPLGAVVLVIDGTGVQEVEGTGGTRAFTGPVNGTSRRVVLVGPGAGAPLTFDIEMDDVAEGPSVVAQSAVDTSNQDVPVVTGIDVRLRAR